MAVAQMSWGKMKFPIDDPRLKEFLDSLAGVYQLAENHPGFIWRIPDGIIATELKAGGFNSQISATVSVWRSVNDLHDYTFNSLHGAYLGRTAEWFEKVDGPQLVIWDVEDDARPSFKEAWERLHHLKQNGPSAQGYGWPTSVGTNNSP